MSGSLKQQFDEDGFLVLRGFLDSHDVARLRAAWETFRLDIAPTLDKRQVMYENYDDPSTVKQSNALHLEPRFDALRFSGKVHDLAVSLLGPVTPQHIEYFDKPPGQNHPTPPHQDGYYFCLRPNLACTVWIPLEPIEESNGALTYYRGSHKLGVREHGASSVLGFSQGLVEDPALLGEPVSCPVEPGDVLVHHSLTIHRAGPNRSATRRRAVIGYVFFSASSIRDEEMWARYEASLLRQHQAKGIVA
jgi:phytanoyl-CoA hydroxylase